MTKSLFTKESLPPWFVPAPYVVQKALLLNVNTPSGVSSSIVTMCTKLHKISYLAEYCRVTSSNAWNNNRNTAGKHQIQINIFHEHSVQNWRYIFQV